MIGLVTVDEYIAYAKAIGVDLASLEADVLESQLTMAIRFIDSLDSRLKGKRTEQTQPHAYPRRDLTIYGDPWPSDIVPQLAKDAQMAFALEVHDGIDIFGAKTGMPVIKERVDVLEVQYAAPKEATAEERESLAMFLLRELMDVEVVDGGVGFLNMVRT